MQCETPRILSQLLIQIPIHLCVFFLAAFVEAGGDFLVEFAVCTSVVQAIGFVYLDELLNACVVQLVVIYKLYQCFFSILDIILAEVQG